MDQFIDLEKKSTTESSFEHSEKMVSVHEVVHVTPENMQADLVATNAGIEKQEGIITATAGKVNEIRHSLGLEGQENNIPSVELNRQKITKLKEKKVFLEQKLKEVLESNISEKYRDVIEKVRKSKIDWANSLELTRRLKLRGADEEDLINIKNWLVDNATEAKVIILPPPKFKDLTEILYEMTNEANIKDGKAFHVSGGRDDVPEYIKNSVVMQEKPPLPPLPGKEKNEAHIDESVLHHEFGHVTQSGLLESNAFEDWNPKMKKNSPDSEYVGDIKETDTRIRSMYRDLDGLFDPGKEVFGRKHLNILQEKFKNGELNEDTKDLLSHYDPIELVKLANRMPAI